MGVAAYSKGLFLVNWLLAHSLWLFSANTWTSEARSGQTLSTLTADILYLTEKAI